MPSQADDSFLRTKSSFVMYFCIGNKVSPCFALSFCSGDGTYSFFKVSPFLFLLCYLKALKYSSIVLYDEKILQEKLIFVFYNSNIIQFIFFIKQI